MLYNIGVEKMKMTEMIDFILFLLDDGKTG